MLDHKVNLFLAFWETSMLFSTMALPTYILTNSVGELSIMRESGVVVGREIREILREIFLSTDMSKYKELNN